MRNQASAAAYLGLKPTTLQDWRTRGTVQLPYVKMGSRVFYRQADLDLFLESRIYTHTGEYQPINTKPLTSDDFEVTNAKS
jgi:hypothetical protein|tara:strand:+ start:266 stop:508 length:243 start_codon:yes stop_codon:yes gene_type:complete